MDKPETPLTKGELRKQRQAEHAAREAARIESGDTRNAEQRKLDREVAARRRRRKPRAERRPAVGSQEWAETRGDDLGESPDY